MKHTSKLIAASSLLTASAVAQIPLTGLAPSYSQDFDSLLRTTTAETWVNNVTTTSANDAPRVIGLEGWHTGAFGTTTVTPLIRAGTGSSAVGSFYSFGSASASDRALGTLPSDSTASASMRLGVSFVNNTGLTITGFTFSYTGEQWRKAQLVNATNNQFVVTHATFDAGMGSLDSVNYSATISGATFNTPIDGGDNVSAALDGNLSANRISGLGSSISLLTVAPGQEIWIRWFDQNSSSADHGIAIDDFEINFTTAIPEPSSFAALAGLGALAAFVLRRGRRV